MINAMNFREAIYVSAEDIKLLDVASRKAQRGLTEMIADLDRLNAKLDATFARMDRRHHRQTKERAAQ
jgi:hypothetical protein